jgi:CheY-like chemotaxis protein/HPt (histidine-containing phosphotransfer) domain-containing protein
MASMQPNRSPVDKNGQRNTIHHDELSLAKFLDELDAKSGGNKNPKRQYVRWPYRVAAVKMTIMHASGNPAVIHVACRNLSAGGIGVLHRAYVHKGTRVSVALPRVDGDVNEVEGFVVRCIYVKGAIHDVGIQFNEPVNARDYVNLDPFADGFSLEKVNPEELKGNVLYVEDSSLDQSLVRHFLRETQLRLQFAKDKAEATAKSSEGFDLILCDYNLGDDDGADIVKTLRDDGITTPIIMLTADKSTSTREKLIAAQANAFLSKPLQQTMLFRAIAEFMITNAGSGSLTSSLPPTHPNRGLLPTFIEQVKDYAKGLDKTVKDNNVPKCRSLCLQIAGAAPVMGFERLAELARSAETAVAASMSIQESMAPIRQLMNACLKVTARG